MEFGANVFWAGFLESVTGLARIFPGAARLVSCSTRLSPGSAGVDYRVYQLEMLLHPKKGSILIWEDVSGDI